MALLPDSLIHVLDDAQLLSSFSSLGFIFHFNFVYVCGHEWKCQRRSAESVGSSGVEL